MDKPASEAHDPNDLYIMKLTRELLAEEINVCLWKNTDDGYRWEAYGSRKITEGGSTNRKAYYRCCDAKIPHNCQAKKIVQEHPDDPRAVVVTYKGKHNHRPVKDMTKVHPILRLIDLSFTESLDPVELPSSSRTSPIMGSTISQSVQKVQDDSDTEDDAEHENEKQEETEEGDDEEDSAESGIEKLLQASAELNRIQKQSPQLASPKLTSSQIASPQTASPQIASPQPANRSVGLSINSLLSSDTDSTTSSSVVNDQDRKRQHSQTLPSFTSFSDIFAAKKPKLYTD
eukprot:c12765_g1_i3.p1 GENE.c12765_g1_i3~~c12765_g1_i3.p1  ORF type:complete len:300 (+),score=99.89 c12765_g1_i3:37-900(+)